MKRILFFAVVAFLATSCSTMFTTTTYRTSLVSVESPENAKVKYGETKIATITGEDGLSKYSYEDDFISVIWFFGKEQISFTLKNKSGFSIKLPWDDMAYVNEKGESKRVIHSGVKLVDRNAAQATSVVAKNASIDDILIPTDNIYYVSGQYGGWRYYPLFPRYSSQEEANSAGKVGQKVSILFPIIIQDVQNEYVFEFQIDDVTVK